MTTALDTFSPTPAHLSRLYHELSNLGARCVGEKKSWPLKNIPPENLICLGAVWSRYDPRLVEVMVEFLNTHWMDFNPLKIREALQHAPCPQTLLVIFNFIVLAQPNNAELAAFV